MVLKWYSTPASVSPDRSATAAIEVPRAPRSAMSATAASRMTSRLTMSANLVNTKSMDKGERGGSTR